MDMDNFTKIVNDIKSSFSMENLKLSDEVVSEMKMMYVNNEILEQKHLIKRKRRGDSYDFRRK